MANKKTVGVIGCGISGIVSVKSCLEEGLQPVCFEQYDKIGGVWFYTEEYRENQGARAFDNLTTNVCKSMFAFSDFPYPDDAPPYLTCDLVHKYLQDYCDKFALNEHIHLNTLVTKVKKSGDHESTGKWDVHTDGKNGPQQHTFDFVILGPGYFKKSCYPDIPGIDTFSGSISHSKDFKNGLPYKGQRVLVVGNGYSAGDLSSAVANHADQTFLGVGKGTYLIPRYGPKGHPYEYYLFRRCNFVSAAKINKVFQEFCNNSFDLKNAGLLPQTPPAVSSFMINSEIQIKILNGKVKVVGKLKRVGPHEAEFEDGTVIENLDRILFATGYDTELDIVQESLMDAQGKMEIYKMMFPLKLSKNTLALVGCVHLQGSFPPVAELQARNIARIFSGQQHLPPREEMCKNVEEINKVVLKTNERYRYTFPYMPYKEGLASDLGVMPSRMDLLMSPRIAYLFYYGPTFPFFYRLWGPHTWSGAREAIEKASSEGYYAKQLRKCPE